MMTSGRPVHRPSRRPKGVFTLVLGDIGFPELLLILVIALVIFGPSKLPELGKGLGRGIREFRKATREITDEVNEAIKDDTAAAKKED